MSDISEIDLKGKYVIMKTKAALNLDKRVWLQSRSVRNENLWLFRNRSWRVYMRRYDAVRLASELEVKQAQERFRKNKTWAVEKWKRYQVDRKKTFLDVLKERGGFE